MKVAIIPRGPEGRDAFGHKYGSWHLLLTPEMLQAIRAGDQLAIDINDEYSLFIEAAPEIVTKAAIAELPDMENDPETYKWYRSAEELIKDNL